MIRVPRKPARRVFENTIPLINIVFLMLIFFLVAGTLTPPLDEDVELISLTVDAKAPPPDMVFIRQDGSLSWQGKPAGIKAIEERWVEQHSGKETAMRVAVDQDLPAIKMLEVLEELKSIGSGEIKLITQRGDP